MGITYGDHLIDSGYYDITPEQEREIEERKGTEMTEIVGREYYEGLLAEVVRERENYNAMHQAACLEIDRLQEAKRAALKLADERAKEANGLRQALRAARSLCDDRLGPSRVSLLDKIANVIDAALEEKGT